MAVISSPPNRQICSRRAFILAALAASGAMAQPAVEAFGVEFSLRRVDGSPFTERDLVGKASLVLFGYTHCPDFCPAALFELSLLLKKTPQRAPVQTLFISVDPARDTPAVMKDYLDSFDERIIGLTGDETSVNAAVRAFHAFAEILPGEGDLYTIAHSTVIYLMDSNGRFAGALRLDRGPEAALAQISKAAPAR
jgi:protein SCO1/2